MTTTTTGGTAGTHPGDLSAVGHLVSLGDVDGVPALFANREGPITAGLIFRVGRADETLATAGITHLVEHLALFRQNLSESHHNGATADTYTVFHVTGTETEIAEYLNGVCGALRKLPLDRLEIEKEILRTEAAGRRGGGSRTLRVWRHGAVDHGLPGYDELGTFRLTAAEVQDWARTRFTRENAVLFVTSDHLPAGLDLRLPTGPRLPVPEPSLALPQLPAFVRGADGEIALDAIVPRSSAASVFTQVAARALFRDLRQEGGFSYVADGDYSPIDGDRVRITLFADALADKQDAVVGAVVDTLTRLRRAEVADADLAAAKSRMVKDYDAPELGAALLPSYAMSLLMGHPVSSPEEARAKIQAVTAAEVREVAQAVWDGALWLVPGRGVDWAGPAEALSFPDVPVVEGTRLPRQGDPDVSLILGTDGVSLASPAGVATVRFDDLAAMTTRPDGARSLMANDGFFVAVEPTLHPGLTAEVVAAEIDARVPAQLVVPLPARNPDRIPQPGQDRGAESPDAAKAQRRALDRHRAGTVLLVTCTILAWLVGMIVLVVVLVEIGVGGASVSLVAAGFGLVASVRKIVRSRRARTPGSAS